MIQYNVICLLLNMHKKLMDSQLIYCMQPQGTNNEKAKTFSTEDLVQVLVCDGKCSLRWEAFVRQVGFKPEVQE